MSLGREELERRALLGGVLRREREARAVKITQIAATAGVNRAYLTRIEAGGANLSVKVATAYEQCLGIRIHESSVSQRPQARPATLLRRLDLGLEIDSKGRCLWILVKWDVASLQRSLTSVGIRFHGLGVSEIFGRSTILGMGAVGYRRSVGLQTGDPINIEIDIADLKSNGTDPAMFSTQAMFEYPKKRRSLLFSVPKGWEVEECNLLLWSPSVRSEETGGREFQELNYRILPEEEIFDAEGETGELTEKEVPSLRGYEVISLGALVSERVYGIKWWL